MRIAITGKPGCGKTTLCMRLFEGLKGVCKISGVVTKEVREKGRRIGFVFYDLDDGEQLWLAHVENESEIRVGKYGVFVENIGRIAKKLKSKEANVIIVDEIGPMELKSSDFIETVNWLIDGGKDLIFTIHLKSRHPLLERIRSEFKVFSIDERNREKVLQSILDLIRRKYEGRRG